MKLIFTSFFLISYVCYPQDIKDWIKILSSKKSDFVHNRGQEHIVTFTGDFLIKEVKFFNKIYNSEVTKSVFFFQKDDSLECINIHIIKDSSLIMKIYRELGQPLAILDVDTLDNSFLYEFNSNAIWKYGDYSIWLNFEAPNDPYSDMIISIRSRKKIIIAQTFEFEKKLLDSLNN